MFYTFNKICRMYELGRNFVRMQMKFPDDYLKRIIISCESEYKRRNGVIIQSQLALGKNMVHADESDQPFCELNHASEIHHAYYNVKNNWR